MKQIWKYSLALETGEQTVLMPRTARLVEVALQFERPTMWAEVNSDDTEPAARYFAVTGTGTPVEDTTWQHVGVVHDLKGNRHYVWHVWETTSWESIAQADQAGKAAQAW